MVLTGERSMGVQLGARILTQYTKLQKICQCLQRLMSKSGAFTAAYFGGYRTGRICHAVCASETLRSSLMDLEYQGELAIPPSSAPQVLCLVH